MPGSARSQTRYLRAYFIQWCVEGETSTYGESSYFEFPGEDGLLGTPDDRNLLLDGGRSGSKNILISFLDEKIGPGGVLWNMALSSPGSDHYGGMQAVAERYQVVNFYENIRWPEGEKSSYDTLIGTLQGGGTDMFTYDAGDYLSGPETGVGTGWDPYVSARVLCANASSPSGSSDNAWSGLIQIRCGESVILTGGDALGNKQEGWVLNETSSHSYPGALSELAETDLYKVHHHGSASSSEPEFLAAMTPDYAVSQTAYGTGPGSRSHPRKEALDSVMEAGGIVYRNDLDGTVIVKCDSLGNFDIVRERAYVDEWETPGGSRDLVYPPPDVPQGLVCTDAGADYVTICWEPVPGASGYDIFRSTIDNGDPGAGLDANPGCEPTGIYQKINTENVTELCYTDDGLSEGVTYHYRVSAKKIYSQEGYRVCYERRYSNQISQLIDLPAAPTATQAPTVTSSPTPSLTPTPHLPTAPTATPTPTGRPTETPSPDPTAAPTSPPASDLYFPVILSGDYDGDGFSDIAIYRPDNGLWIVRNLTRVYFGQSGDIPVPADYDGDGTTDIAVFRAGYGMWAVRDVSRFYYGREGDRPVCADYDGDGSDDCALFRASEGRWLLRGISQTVFGKAEDLPLADDWDGDGTADMGIYRPENGLWAIKDNSRFYFGTEEDLPVTGDLTGDGVVDPAVFRPTTGLWAVKNGDRVYFGTAGDRPLVLFPKASGKECIAVFREGTGLWAVRGGTRVYFGRSGDLPVTR